MLRSFRHLMRGRLAASAVSLAVWLSAALVLPVTIAPVSAASPADYAQGQAMATYDTISYPAMPAPKGGGPSVALKAYRGPLLVRANPDGTTVDSGLGSQWQCVELVQRYFFGKHWVDVPKWNAKSAYLLPTAIPTNSKGPEAIYEAQSKHPTVAPKPGDMLVFNRKANTWPDGHVALITGVSSTMVTFIQQNVTSTGRSGDPPVALDQLAITKTGSGSTATYSIASKSTRSGVTYPAVLGWIHAKANHPPAPARPVLVSPGAAQGSAPPGTYSLNLRLQGGEDQVTLTTADVDAAGQIRLWFVYLNTSQSTWGLYCPADPQAIHLTLRTGTTVAPLDTYCSHNVGQVWYLPPGGTINIWGLFPALPDPSQPFSLNWYEWNAPTVSL